MESWESVVKRLRQQIAENYPGWTDHNAHDPGITIMELFVWLTQVQQYHAAQIGMSHWEKFRKLSGIPRELRRPGRTLVTVDAAEGALIRAGTKFYADNICFETAADQMVEEAIFLAFRAVADGTEQVLKGTWLIRGKGISLYPFGRRPKPGNYFEIECTRPLQPDMPYRLTIESSKSYPLKRCRVVEEQYDGHGFYPLAEIKMEYRAAGGWCQAVVTGDDTYGFLQDGSICFHLPEAIAASEWKFRFILVRSDYLVAPVIGRISMAMVEVWQQETCFDYAQWDGDGLPDQRYELDDHRILTDALVLEVEREENPGQMEVWQQVDDFSRSEPEDCHYCLAQGVLQFGDGFHGKMPEGRIRIRKLIKSLGELANIKAGTITHMAGENPYSAVNEWPVTGGTAERPAQETVERYAAEKELLLRAVSCEDYETLIGNIPGLLIEDCKVYCDRPEKRELKLAVKPYAEDGRGRLNAAYTKNIYRYLEGKRMIGTRLQVISPEYYGLEIVCVAAPDIRYRDAAARIETEISNWVRQKRFGEGISYGELRGKIVTMACVRRVESLWIDAGNRVRRNTEGDLLLPPNGLFWLKRIVCNLLEA